MSTENTEEFIEDLIEDAEEINDPLEGIVEKTASNPGAAFADDVLEQLAQLKKTDRSAFETLRTQLKRVGCRVTELDKLVAEKLGNTSERAPTQPEILVKLAQQAELFRTSDTEVLATITSNGYRKNFKIKSREFRLWLTHAFIEADEGVPGSEALRTAINAIEANAQFNAPEYQIYLRVGELDGKFYLDLCDEAWRAVEIDADGWRLIENPPIRFIRAAGMLPLPVPVSGGSIDDLKPFLNIQTDQDFVLAVSVELACMRPNRSYPIMDTTGEHGTAKTTFFRVLRALVDPNVVPDQPFPDDPRDLYISAKNSHIMNYDNLSNISAKTADHLCRIATGTGDRRRALYEDDREVLTRVTKPVWLNGIPDIVSRPDLADRAVFIGLQPIPEEKRKAEEEFWAEFEEKRPLILGALLDGVVHGIKKLPDVRLEKLPRMADFAKWATACEGQFWEAGSFIAAYQENRTATTVKALEDDSVACAIQTLLGRDNEFKGTFSQLLDKLDYLVKERVLRSKYWPDGPRALSARLRRIAPALREAEIECSFDEQRVHGGNRIVTLTKKGDQPKPPNDDPFEENTTSKFKVYKGSRS